MYSLGIFKRGGIYCLMLFFCTMSWAMETEWEHMQEIIAEKREKEREQLVQLKEKKKELQEEEEGIKFLEDQAESQKRIKVCSRES